MKKLRALALMMAVVLAVPTTPITAVKAADLTDDTETVVENGDAKADYEAYKKTAGYKQVWADEFEGTLNREAWNVELHDPKWVNDEWQAYVDDDDNIYLDDGKLKIQAKYNDGTTGAVNLIGDSSAICKTHSAIEAVGDGDDWKVQGCAYGIKLEKNKTYLLSFKAKTEAVDESNPDRDIHIGAQHVTDDKYYTYCDFYPYVMTTENSYSYVFCMKEDTDEEAAIFFNMGRTPGKNPSKVTISDVELFEVPTVNVDGYDWVCSSHTVSQNQLDKNQEYTPSVSLTNVNLVKGRKYRIDFMAQNITADNKGRDIKIVAQQNVSPYDNYCSSIVRINQWETYYHIDFAMEKDTDASAMIQFDLGAINGAEPSTVKLDKVFVTDITGIDNASTAGYTSGRISTQNKQTFTYGLFECYAKIPENGDGFLPAFWLMANDENVYGQWPRCGEIDAMEVWGSNPEKLFGTIHYGNPHHETQGTYELEGTDFSKDYHLFSVEWLPGKIIWYVDGQKYKEADDWFSTTEGKGTLTYPAPFDQPFYIILNLAVGNSWAGEPTDDTKFEDNPFEIDYVRVYQKSSYDENVERPNKNVILRDPDENGNYINNGSFNAEDITDDVDWKFMTALGGDATAKIDKNTIVIDTKNQGTVDYSVQLVQAGIPFEKGATYEIKFDAWSDAARVMGVDIKAPDNGYCSYMPSKTAELTTTKQTYTYTFRMLQDSDANGRLEYNMGAKDSTAAIHIQNVSIKKIKEADLSDLEAKTLLSDGNFIYNGSFDMGANRLGDWDIEGPDCAVTDFSDGRRLKSTITSSQSLKLSQNDLAVVDGLPYVFTMNVEANAAITAKVNICGNEQDISIDSARKTYEIKFNKDTEIKNKSISIEFVGDAVVLVDDVKLTEDALLINGAFDNGSAGYEIYVDSSAAASTNTSNKELEVLIENTGNEDWKVQIKRENVPLYKDHVYELRFTASSSLDRKIKVVVQGNEERNWAAYSGESVFEVGNDKQRYAVPFIMNEATDLNAFFSICLGKIDEQIKTKHTVVIDDVSLVDLTEAGVATVSVNFDSNGGTITSGSAKIDGDLGNPIGTLPTVIYDGFRFIGWFTDSIGGKEVKDTDLLTDTTYYANWEYDVTYDANGGKIGENNKEIKSIILGKALGTLPVASNADYNFLGWYTEKNGGEKVTAETVLSKATTLYAHWGYTVTLDINGGKLADGVALTINKAAGEAVGELPIPTKENHEFLGWFTDKTAGTEVTKDTKLTKDTTIYARFKENVFKVTFDANSGLLDADKATKTVTVGQKYGELPVPTRNDQAFLGWFTDKEEGEEVTADTVVDLIKDQTLYAHWGDIALAVKQKYDVSKCFEGIEGIQGYKVKNIDGKATITKNGMLTAKKAGLVSVLPCEKVNGKLKEMDVDPVYFDISAPKFDGKLKATYVKEVINPLDYIVGIPTNSNVVKVTLANEKFATLSENGIDIIASKSGKVKVTVIIENTQGSQVKLNTTLTVKIPKLSCKEKFSLRKNKTKTLSVKNIERTDSVIWESSDPEIVTVTQTKNKAKIKAVGQGTAIITCTVNDHPYSTTVTVP